MEEDGEDGKKEKAGWFFFNKMGVFLSPETEGPSLAPRQMSTDV